MDERPLGWGVMGTGAIATAFADDLRTVPGARLAAVGSRTPEAAGIFGERFAIDRRYGSYAAVAADPQVDVVYVATPHVAHHECAMLAIAAGKAVLVEKPFTVNATEAASLIRAARAQNTFLMEAMWTRFLPHIVRVRELIAAGALGSVRSLTAELGGRAPQDPGHRLNDPALGGGALLDIGVYLASFASMLFGTPDGVVATGHLSPTGVDAQTAMILSYAGGAQAVLLATIETDNANRAHINGTRARIEIDRPFFMPADFRLIGTDGRVESFDDVHEGNGLRYQAIEVMRCLRAGHPESAGMPLDETLQIMTTLDAIRRRTGLRYPGERSSAGVTP